VLADSQPVRVVTEDSYRLSPQEVQRRAQDAFAAKVRSLLETRLQQRVQQARQAAAERLAEQRNVRRAADVAATAATAEPLSSAAWPSTAPEVADNRGFRDMPAEGPAAPATTDGAALPLPFTTARLAVAEVATTAPTVGTEDAAVDVTKYAETIDAYPYSAVDLVRVHRLKGIPNHNRGLFAALARRSFTTRSGHLVVNPGLVGKRRVRSAVSGHVWDEQHLRQHPLPHSSCGAHEDAAATTRANNACSSSAAVPSRISSDVQAVPPYLVMKVVHDGNKASFMWTEDDTSCNGAGGGDGKEPSTVDGLYHADTSLNAALADVLKHKYGKQLSEEEKVEAERRLHERRCKEQQPLPPRKKETQTADGTPVDSGGIDGDGASTDAGAGRNSSAHASPNDRPLLIHDLLPTVDEDDMDNATLPGGQIRAASSDVHAGMAAVSTSSSSRPPPGSTSVSGVDSAAAPQLSSARDPRCTSASRASLSRSDLEHTVSVGEGQERQQRRQARAEPTTTRGTAPSLQPRERQKPHEALPGPPVKGPLTSSGDTKKKETSDEGDRHDHAKQTEATGQQQTPTSSHHATPTVKTTDMDAAVQASPTTVSKETNATATTPVLLEHSCDGAKKVGDTASYTTTGGRTTGSHPSATTTAATLSGGKTTKTGAKRKASTTTAAPKDGAEHQQLDAFLKHFPEAAAHVQLRREAKSVLDELADMWDEDVPMSERSFPLPQFASQDYRFPASEDDGTDEEGDRQRRPHHRPSRGDHVGPPPEEPVVGFDVDVEALQAKFKAEAAEECADLAAQRDALLSEVVLQRQLIRDFADDVHFLSVGCAHNELTAEQYAIELTRNVNAYAREHHLQFHCLSEEEEEALREQAALAEEQGVMMGFLERFGSDRVPTRDVGCQVSDADLCYVDAAVRSTEAQLESLFHHERALLIAVRLATVAVANILSFHASLEMESTCHECFFVFDKPRTLWPCGHTFCHACLSTMYNARGDLICAECGSACEVGYTPNLQMELIANYQTVYTRNDADTKSVSNTALAEERDAQTVEGVLRNLLNDLLATQHSWRPSSAEK
jgi:hypothetical protein